MAAMNEQQRKNRYRKKRAMLRRVQNKVSVAFFIIVIGLLVLATRILIINYSKSEVYSREVLNHQSYTSTTIPYKRGQILDANGTVLAYSEKVYNLILDPKLVLSDEKYRQPTLDALTSCFELDRTELENILATKPDSQYEKLAKELTADEIAGFKELQKDKENNPYIKGVWFEESYIRKYPFSTLACDAIGFASAVNGGELGLEFYYNDELSGTDGSTYSYVDENLDVKSSQKKAVDGNNLVTTIDYQIQSIVEKKIFELNEERPSTSTSVLVMNPNTGGVLAMASYPNFDLNNPRDLSAIYTPEQLESMSDEEMTTAMYALWKNYCVSSIIEPGSTFKPFTVAAGLEEGVISSDESFECTGSQKVADWTINCHAIKIGGHGTIDLRHSLMLSCNPAMMQIAEKLGGEKLSKYESLFGFGSKTNIDLPGEEYGLIKDEDMSEVDAATNSFGQNLNVTMVQMASAFSSLVNGGNYYQPHMIKRIEKSTGEVVKNIEPVVVRQTVTADTSELIRDFLRSVVDEGTASKAGVTGYDIGGKTGTAQKQPREERKWVSSFIGCAPTKNPQVVIYTVVDEPYQTSGTTNGSSDSLNLSHEILKEILPYLNIYKDSQAQDNTSDVDVEGAVDVPSTE